MSFVSPPNIVRVNKPNTRLSKTPKNLNRVTARIVYEHDIKRLYIGIGKNIAKHLGFTLETYVDILIHQKYNHFYVIKEVDHKNGYGGHKLTGDLSPKSRLLHFSITCHIPDNYRISQTIVLDYTIPNHKLLFVDFTKMIYRELV